MTTSQKFQTVTLSPARVILSKGEGSRFQRGAQNDKHFLAGALGLGTLILTPSWSSAQTKIRLSIATDTAVAAVGNALICHEKMDPH